MKNYTLLTVFLISFFTFNLFSQNEPVILEAESGVVGSDYNIINGTGIDYVCIGPDLINAENPGSAKRIISFTVTFPDTGAYDLYGRIQIGGGADNDDSFFYGNGLGEKDTINDDDWITVNNIGGIGFADPEDYVLGIGGVLTEVWKWMNFSEQTGQENPVVFLVEPGNLTQTFQIGARENGLCIDKLAFCPSEYYYTVSNLDNIEPGTLTPDIEIEVPDGPPLANGKCKFLGSAYSEYQAPYFERLWNQVIPENAGKWGSVEEARDTMNWNDLDTAYYLAKNNGYPFNLHVLIWGNQQPSWIESLDAAEQLEEIEEWFAAVADRYDDLDIVQVVNEPLHDPPQGAGNGNYIDALGGTGSSGWDWVLEAFRMARTNFPESDLMINDYNIVNSTSNTNDYIEVIELLQAEDLIDAIGVQAHNYALGASAATIESNLDLLAETGLPIYATEFDLGSPSDNSQLQQYQSKFPVFWEHPAVQGITLWGYRPGTWTSSAFLLNADGSERPAMTWLRSYITDNTVVEDCVSSLENHTAGSTRNNIQVYPNPSDNGIFKIDGINGITSIAVIDVSGNKVAELKVLNQSSVHIDLDVLPGLYIIHLSDGKSIYHKKIIIN